MFFKYNFIVSPELKARQEKTSGKNVENKDNKDIFIAKNT